MKKAFIPILFISLFMVSCKCSKNTQANEEVIEFSATDVWQLTHMRGSKVTYNGSDPVTMQFNPESGTVNGFAGCNRYFGNYTSKIADTPESGTQGEITFNGVGATKMMCPEPEMRIEDKFLPLIEKSTRYSLSAYSLIIYQKDNRYVGIKIG